MPSSQDIDRNLVELSAMSDEKTSTSELVELIFGDDLRYYREGIRHHESNKDALLVAYDKLFLPVMNDLTKKIAVYGVDNAENIALVLTDINNLIADKFRNHNPDTRGKILFETMKHAFEELKSSTELSTEIVVLPEKAKTKYVSRNNSGKASDFLKKHWGTYIEAGVCFRPDIKRLDPKLETALTNEFTNRANELRSILPTYEDRADRKIVEYFGGPVRPEDRKAALTAISMIEKLKS